LVLVQPASVCVAGPRGMAKELQLVLSEKAWVLNCEHLHHEAEKS